MPTRQAPHGLRDSLGAVRSLAHCAPEELGTGLPGPLGSGLTVAERAATASPP